MTGAITHCRACGNPRTNFSEGIDLGEQHLSDFRTDDSRPPRYPLHMIICGRCGLAQLDHTAPRDELFHTNYSFKSGVSEVIRDDLSGVVSAGLEYRRDPASWLDIASNDGTLLSFVPRGIRRVGVDPLRQFADEAKRHADEIIVDFFSADVFDTHTRFDVITSVSMFYDLDDPGTFIEQVSRVLSPRGVWIIQQNYLPTMLDRTSVDNVSHEHLTYYCLRTLMPLLSRYGLRVVDVTFGPVNGGCFRVAVCKMRYAANSRVATTLRREYDSALFTPLTYGDFATRAKRRLRELGNLVRNLTSSGRTVYVYGASTRGAVLWQAAGLDVRQLPRVVDRNPDKVGRWMSAIGSPIISEEQARRERPDYMLVGPWWFRREFIEREHSYLASGGRLIFPLPDVEVVTG